MPLKKKRWKHWHDKILKTLWKRGYNSRSAAQRMGFSATTIARNARRLELEPRVPGIKRGMSLKPNRNADIRRLHDTGISPGTLAAQFSLSEKWIKQILKTTRENGKIQQRQGRAS